MFAAIAVVAVAAQVQQAAARQSTAVSALPDVDTVLTKAISRAHDFEEQTLAMQRQVSEQQAKSGTVLVAQKAAYEKTLSALAVQNEFISTNNAALVAANDALHKSNSAMEAELANIGTSNDKMRQVLQAMHGSVKSAKLFLVDSLKVTDDTDSEELHVLAATTPKPTLDHFLAIAGSDKVSLLQMHSHIRGPEDLVNVLSKSLADIATAEAEGAAELKASFNASFEESQKRQSDLNATHAKLMQNQAELKEHQTKLFEAKSRLANTSKQLVGRLYGLRAFAHKLDDLAASSLESKIQQKLKKFLSDVQAENATSQTFDHGMLKKEVPGSVQRPNAKVVRNMKLAGKSADADEVHLMQEHATQKVVPGQKHTMVYETANKPSHRG